MIDQYEGQGGSYVIDANDGRVLVERTEQQASNAEPEPPTLTEEVPHDEPADAGFFSPVAPADHTDHETE